MKSKQLEFIQFFEFCINCDVFFPPGATAADADVAGAADAADAVADPVSVAVTLRINYTENRELALFTILLLLIAGLVFCISNHFEEFVLGGNRKCVLWLVVL